MFNKDLSHLQNSEFLNKHKEQAEKNNQIYDSSYQTKILTMNRVITH